MASPSFLFGVVGLVCLTSSCAVQREKAKPAFMQRISSGSGRVLQPTLVDGQFVRSVIEAHGDVLVLLYSPTCPDCQWLVHKVWPTLAAKLDEDPNLSVMTVADPGYAAPKPFEHDNNPALFFAPKDDKLNPIMFPQSRLAEYLTGLSTQVRSQEQQDIDFEQDLLTFAKGAMGIHLSQQATAKSQSKGLREVQELGDAEWIALQKKWAGAHDYPAPPRALVVPGAPPLSDATLPASISPKTSLMASNSEKLDADQMWVLRVSQGEEKLEKAEKWAVAYAQQYVQDHPGKGYTAEGVFRYSLPYYQEQVREGRV